MPSARLTGVKLKFTDLVPRFGALLTGSQLTPSSVEYSILTTPSLSAAVPWMVGIVFVTLGTMAVSKLIPGGVLSADLIVVSVMVG